MNEVWNLDVIYKGFDDPAFAADLQALKAQVAAFAELAEKLSAMEPAAGLREGIRLQEELNKLGMKLEVYSYEWDGLIPALNSGAVDAIIAGMSPTAEREEQIDFTNVYYSSNLVIIYKKK